VGALDLPSEPEEPGRADHARDQGADRPNARDVPDPDARGRAYEAARTHVSVEAAGEAGPVGPPEGSSYWHRASGFADQAADYRKRWSADGQTVPDRSADPPGSFRSDGGSYLNPDRHAEAVMAIGRVREAEPAISADMRTIERENRHGGWLEGFDRRIKGDDRLKEKVAEKLEAEPRLPTGKAICEIADAIRYTFCFQPESYARGQYQIKEQLESRGYEMCYSKNSWTDLEYKGINTRWVAPDGQRFEVQFHTPESFHAKHHVTHTAYERIRNPTASRSELRELHAFQREVCSHIRVPEGAADIPDYRKKGF
jgi:hypothetical protein